MKKVLFVLFVLVVAYFIVSWLIGLYWSYKMLQMASPVLEILNNNLDSLKKY